MKKCNFWTHAEKISLAIVLLALNACTIYDTKVNDVSGRATIYDDPSTVSRVSGVGIESQDISAMSDRMMRDILATSVLL